MFLKLILLLIILLLILIILIVLFISTSWVCFARDSDSSHSYLNSWYFIIFLPCPVEEGRDRAALEGNWHPDNVSGHFFLSFSYLPPKECKVLPS